MAALPMVMRLGCLVTSVVVGCDEHAHMHAAPCVAPAQAPPTSAFSIGTDTRACFGTACCRTRPLPRAVGRIATRFMHSSARFASTCAGSSVAGAATLRAALHLTWIAARGLAVLLPLLLGPDIDR